MGTSKQSKFQEALALTIWAVMYGSVTSVCQKEVVSCAAPLAYV